MYILTLAIKNLLRNKKKTFILGFLITTVSLLVFVANGIFEKTNTGLEELYVDSLTGDFLIAKDSEKINSIFGYEMPLVSSYEPIAQLEDFSQLSDNLSNYKESILYTPIISAAVRLELGGNSQSVAIFGIEAESYFDVVTGLGTKNANIDSLKAGNGGILLNETLVNSIEARTGKPLEIGETIQLTTSTDGTFRIRKAEFAGTYSYDSNAEPFNKMVLCDPQIVRELLLYTNNSEEEIVLDEDTEEYVNADFDDLFGDDFFGEDVFVEEDATSDEIFDNLEDLFESSADDETDYASIVTWSFILARTAEGYTPREVLHILENNVIQDSDVQIKDWVESAGYTAQAPVALQMSFNIGMVFIIIGSILVIVNGLVISVLERTKEIGTMRAIGASKGFVTKLYSAEMMILILFFSILGMLLGILVSVIIQAYPIHLSNAFLVTLFGSEMLSPLISAKLILTQLGISFLVAILAWQYPVLTAIRIQPVETMGKDI